jgi:hypothetical protein
VAHQHLTGSRTVDAGDDVDQRGLATARLANDRAKLTAPDCQVDASERREAASRRFIGLENLP